MGWDRTGFSPSGTSTVQPERIWKWPLAVAESAPRQGALRHGGRLGQAESVGHAAGATRSGLAPRRDGDLTRLPSAERSRGGSREWAHVDLTHGPHPWKGAPWLGDRETTRDALSQWTSRAIHPSRQGRCPRNPVQTTAHHARILLKIAVMVTQIGFSHDDLEQLRSSHSTIAVPRPRARSRASGSAGETL